mmetsp:Transcript_18063/g.32357  ORF Transcript_18063/g.32357 Transcript_18063/m.32357 type:complete len:194 (-) Transcript_18063:67-648(-)
MSDFFWATGKIFPVYRNHISKNNGGLNQLAIDQAVGHISRGDWFHIFPEGRVAYPQLWSPTDIGPLRWGVGKIAVESYRKTGYAPVVVPFVHRGMHINLRRDEESYVFPLPRTPIRILIGEALDLNPTIEAHYRSVEKNKDWKAVFDPTDEDLYEKVTEKIRKNLLDLQGKMDKIIIEEEGTESASLRAWALR